MAVEERGAHRAQQPYLSPRGRRIFRSRGAYERLPAEAARYWPDGGSRERRSSDAHASSRSSSARSTRRGPGSGATVLVAGEAGIGKTRLASELATRARDAGFEVLLGRSIDLVGTELPYQPFVEALRPLGEPSAVDGTAAGSQLRVFEETLALLTERAAAAPVLLVLEDLHWADTSTLDLVVFLAHNLDDRRVLLLATYRADEPSSAERMRRLADGVRRSGSALVLELGPLEREELTALLAARAGRSAAGGADGRDRRPLRGQPLLRRGAPRRRRRPSGRAPARPARPAAAARGPARPPRRRACCAWPRPPDATSAYPLLRAVGGAARSATCASRCAEAVEHGVLVAEQATGSFRFRHALLAEAIYATILPGEREELHARLADELARSGAASPAELAPHWAAAGRSDGGAGRLGRGGTRRRRPSSASPRLSRTSSGRSRCGTPCRTRPSSPGSTSPSSAPGRPSSPAKSVPRRARSSSHGERSSSSATATRTARRSSTCASASTCTQTGSNDAGLAALERAVELVPARAALAGARVRAGVARGRR